MLISLNRIRIHPLGNVNNTMTISHDSNILYSSQKQTTKIVSHMTPTSMEIIVRLENQILSVLFAFGMNTLIVFIPKANSKDQM